MPFSNRYRHDLLENGFGIEWMDDNDENHSKNSVISVRSVYNNHNTRLPAHIWRSIAKVIMKHGDKFIELFFSFHRLYPVM